MSVKQAIFVYLVGLGTSFLLWFFWAREEGSSHCSGWGVVWIHFWGMVTALFALLLSFSLDGWIFTTLSLSSGSSSYDFVRSFFVIAPREEALRFLVLSGTVIYFFSFETSLSTRMILFLGVCFGLGFATFEDFIYLRVEKGSAPLATFKRIFPRFFFAHLGHILLSTLWASQISALFSGWKAGKVSLFGVVSRVAALFTGFVFIHGFYNFVSYTAQPPAGYLMLLVVLLYLAYLLFLDPVLNCRGRPLMDG